VLAVPTCVSPEQLVRDLALRDLTDGARMITVEA
jgi:hypothetical protein